MTFTHALSTNNYGPAKFVVSPAVYEGTHTTIQAAITAASAGDTVFIRAKSTAYVENLTLKAGVNISAFGSDSSLNGTGKVIISGTCTMTTAGSVTISGIQLQTNSAAFLAITGSANSVVNLNNCYLNATNNTGITFSTSGASSALNISNCAGDLGTTGIGMWTITAAGVMTINNSIFTNSGGSTTASTTSTAGHLMRWSFFAFPMSTSSAGSYTFQYCSINTSATNTTAITTAGTGVISVSTSRLLTGSASCVSTGAGTTFNCDLNVLNSSNTNVLTGAGTIAYGLNDFDGSAQTINTTTQSNINGGNWTPVLQFGGGTTGITYSTQAGQYLRTGNTCFISARIVLSNKGSSTGSATISGIPFTAQNVSVNYALASRMSVITYPAGTTMTTAEIDAAGTSVVLLAQGTTLANTALADTNFANTSVVMVAGSYFI